MRSFFRITTLAALLFVSVYAIPGCSSDEGAGGMSGKMDGGAMDKGKMGGGMSGKMESGAMGKGKMDGGAMDRGKMDGGSMDKGKMDAPAK